MSVISLRDTQVSFDNVGSGTPVVLVHGHPFNRTMWKPQLSYFSSKYRVIVPDLRGYGESKVTADKTLLEDFARDIAALLDRLQIQSIVLGGLSMGGQIVLEFVRLFPDKVCALILADTFAQLDTPEAKQNRLDTADRLMREGMTAYANEVLPKMVAPTTIEKQPEIARFVLEMMTNTNPVGAAAALRGRAERQDYTNLLSQINVSTLVMVGELDEFTPIKDAEFMHERIRNSRLVIVENAGHMPNLEQPKTFNKEVGCFLEEVNE